MSSRVVISIRVPCSPIQAFEVFTEEIGEWWTHSDMFRFTPEGPGVMAIEPPGDDGKGGRLIERHESGKVFKIGDIRQWRPGELLVLGWRQASFGPEHATEVEVRFEPVGAETRVTVEHRGWDSVPQTHVARHGFPLSFLYQHQGAQWRAGLERLKEIVSNSPSSSRDDRR